MHSQIIELGGNLYRLDISPDGWVRSSRIYLEVPQLTDEDISRCVDEAFAEFKRKQAKRNWNIWDYFKKGN